MIDNASQKVLILKPGWNSQSLNLGHPSIRHKKPLYLVSSFLGAGSCGILLYCGWGTGGPLSRWPLSCPATKIMWHDTKKIYKVKN